MEPTSITEEEILSGLDSRSISFGIDRSQWIVALQKLYAAKQQLSKAIELYLDEKDFLCAITLSGAANSMLREMLIYEFGKDHLAIQAKLFEFVSQNDLAPTSAAAIIRAENFPANWLKHYGKKKKIEPQIKPFDDQDAAFNSIESTRCFYSTFTIEFTKAWTPERRSKLFGSSQISRWQDHCGDDDYFSD